MVDTTWIPRDFKPYEPPKPRPSRAQALAAVGELNAQAHACGRDEPSDCNAARARLEIIIHALTEEDEG